MNTLRRWRSYARRNKGNKKLTPEHRVTDMKKGLLVLCPDHRYDEACLEHLAQSFVEVLSQGSPEVKANHRREPA